jgi:hypothetical protein
MRTDLKLINLEPHFIKFIDEKTYKEIDIIQDADGIRFLCPECFTKNNGNIGTHSLLCWTPKIPINIYPSPGRWNMIGTGFNDLTLQAGSSSILLSGPGGCGAHFFIKNGLIISC